MNLRGIGRDGILGEEHVVQSAHVLLERQELSGGCDLHAFVGQHIHQLADVVVDRGGTRKGSAPDGVNNEHLA